MHEAAKGSLTLTVLSLQLLLLNTLFHKLVINDLRFLSFGCFQARVACLLRRYSWVDDKATRRYGGGHCRILVSWEGISLRIWNIMPSAVGEDRCCQITYADLRGYVWGNLCGGSLLIKLAERLLMRWDTSWVVSRGGSHAEPYATIFVTKSARSCKQCGRLHFIVQSILSDKAYVFTPQERVFSDEKLARKESMQLVRQSI